MRFKSSIKFSIITILMLFYCSCTLPIEIVIPKENGVKISSTFKNLSGLSVDSKDNLYFVDNNVIKKLDAKNELTIIAGKEKPDIYPEDGIIDGDFNTAKFGQTILPEYIENEKAIYFRDIFEIPNSKDKNYFLRKLTFDNKVKTILKLDWFDDYIYISKNGLIFKINKNKPNKIKRLNSNGVIDEYTFPYEQRIRYIVPDSNGNLYIDCFEEDVNYSSLYRFYNNKWEKIISKYSSKIIFLDQDDNLYMIESEININIDGEKTSLFDSPILLHKIPKEELKKSNLSLEGDKYVIGTFPKFSYNASDFSSKSNTLFIANENSIYKINLKR